KERKKQKKVDIRDVGREGHGGYSQSNKSKETHNNMGRQGSETKIDYIWVSKSWNNSIFSCKVYDADQITASDHKIILGKIETGMHMRKNTFARLWRKDKETLSIDSDKATEEDWNAYKVRLEKEVAKIK